MNADGFILRPMDISDIGGTMKLSMAEGWNQTENDWRLLVEDPGNVCLLAEIDNKIIGTTTAINYANDEAWIGMVLVDKEYRGNGVSKSLLASILEKTAFIKSIKLDATQAGRPVYKKFGFTDEYTIARMVNTSAMKLSTVEYEFEPEPITPRDTHEIVAIDEVVFGVNRKQLIKFLLRYPGHGWLLRKWGAIVGFVLGREGSKYYHIGPLVASSTSDAMMLISTAMEDLTDKSVAVDILCDKMELIEWLNSIGFFRQRDFVRMYKNENPFPGKIADQFLICGPEFG
jgi:GNAT superfamily N-acetyltransferase